MSSGERDKPSLANQLWILFPFFLLHAGAGLSGGFTSILLQHFEQGGTPNVTQVDNGTSCQAQNATATWMGVRIMGDGTQCEQGKGDSNFIILLATAEDYAPIIISILSGFLQQWLGPKRILQMTAVPLAISWTLVMVNPESTILVVLSRFMAGAANGLLTSNVYAADISHRENRQSLKMIEGASRSAGFILIYVLQLIFWNYSDNIRCISAVSLLLPCLSFVGMIFRPESMVFTATRAVRSMKRDNKENKTDKKDNGVTIELLNIQKEDSKENKQNNDDSPRTKPTGSIRFPPLLSPTIFKPLIFITCIICLQYCSGFAFTKKFLLQLLKPKDPTSDPRLSTIFAIAITTIRLFANLFMARLLKTIRVRGLFFFSLFTTAFCLITIGVFLDDCLDLSPLPKDAKEYATVVFLALHVFLVQFGLQTLSGNLTDLLFPTMYKAVMKGVIRAITAVINIIFLFMLTFNVDCIIKYSWTLWVMAGILLITSPILWVFIPEVRNIGKKMATEFYQPNQTVFFLVIPRKGRVNEIENLFKPEHERKSSLNMFKQAVRKVIEVNTANDLSKALASLKIDLYTLSKYVALNEAVEECSEEAATVAFQASFYSKEEILNDKEGKDENQERVSFIHNIHPQNGFLERNKNDGRVLIGKGPVKLEDNLVILHGGLFLFDDVVIVSQCIRSNMRYINERFFRISEKTFSITRSHEKVTFKNSKTIVCVSFENASEAKLWERYVNHYKRETLDLL